jgi:hypothetical protein
MPDYFESNEMVKSVQGSRIIRMDDVAGSRFAAIGSPAGPRIINGLDVVAISAHLPL